MPPFERNEDEERDEFMLAFEAFDKGELTAENANTFELPEPLAKKESDGSADGADQAGRGGQQTGRADSPAAAGDDKTASRDGQRDPRGRFAKGEGEGAPASAAQTAPDAGKPATQQQPATEQPAAVSAPEAAPQGLSAKAAAAWGTASPEARTYIRETEGILAQVSDRLSPLMETAKEHQLPWNEYAGRLVKADKFLRSAPMDAMLWLMETHGVDPDALADMAAARRAGIQLTPQQQQQPSPDINRAVQPLAAKVQEIASRLTQRDEQDRQDAEKQASARKAATKREYDAFVASPEAPHWKEVESQALGIIPAVRAQNPDASVKEVLQKAYDMAAWANPAVRQKLQAEQTRKTQDASRHSRSRDLESMTGHRGAPSGSTQKQSNGTSDPLRDEIAGHFAAFDAR